MASDPGHGAARHRVGLIVPSSNTVMEVDFHRALPPEITVHTARMYLEETTREGELRMINEFVPPAAELVRTVYPDLVVFGCTSAGSLGGLAFDRKVCDDIAKATGARTIGVLSSVAHQLKQLRARRLAVLTPYIDELNQTIRRSLEEDGYEVVHLAGLGITKNYDIGCVTPEQILAFAQAQLRGVRADCLFLSCTNLRSVEAIPLVQQALGIPVIASNHCAIEAVKAHFQRAA
ncbi:MAG: aspartate/glutamate racemase family protein [Deltaproteobacteria bacterium]|nr:aspartate/glutamate racemase family protein [Deltaproteobacteria bacterium]